MTNCSLEQNKKCYCMLNGTKTGHKVEILFTMFWLVSTTTVGNYNWSVNEKQWLLLSSVFEVAERSEQYFILCPCGRLYSIVSL